MRCLKRWDQVWTWNSFMFHLHLVVWRQIYTIFLLHLDFDCYLSHEVWCGIFHLWHHVDTQNVSDFGVFGYIQPVASWNLLHSGFPKRPYFCFSLHVWNEHWETTLKSKQKTIAMIIENTTKIKLRGKDKVQNSVYNMPSVVYFFLKLSICFYMHRTFLEGDKKTWESVTKEETEWFRKGKEGGPFLLSDLWFF